MRRLSQKRLLQAASLVLKGLTFLIVVLWIVRGLQPAIACGLLDALRSRDWSIAYACMDKADYEALLAFLGLMSGAVAVVLDRIAARSAPDTRLGEYHPTPVEQARNRKGMIDRVWNIWIEGHLDQTLYQAVLMSLGMTLRPAALRPGSVRLRRAGEAERPVPEHVGTLQLFDEAGHTLLILGEPGSGKTTMMLDLARSLLERAREDENTPIPVVFNLSSLTDPEQSLDDWLVGEFRSSYDVDEKYARYWLAHDELALLLDGLDEVSADRRAGVVKKLDQYRAQHMDPWLVICCRQDEYAELVANEATVEGVDTVVLQPLTQMQIKSYLADLAGPEPQRLWRALQDDAVLLELADTPLMLNVMLLAAGELDWNALPSDQGPEAVRSFIYDAYIRSMLARPRNTGRRYPDGKTINWLHWLAGKMVGHGQTVFLVERLNRSWMSYSWQRFILVAILVMAFGLIFGLVGGLFQGLVVGLVLGTFCGLLFGLTAGRRDIKVLEQIHFKYGRDRFVGSIKSHLRSRLNAAIRSGLIIGLIFALIVGLVSVLDHGVSTGKLVDKQLIDGLLAGLLIGLFVGLLWLFFDLFLSSLFELIDMSTTLEHNYRMSRPNAAIHQSLINGLLYGPLTFLVAMLFVRLIFGWLDGLPYWLLGEISLGLRYWLFGGIFMGLLIGLRFGLGTTIKHYTLRLVLFLDGSMPLNYVRFLDYCVDRVLLRRVGGGYMFIHRTMMEHFANRDLEKWKDEPS